MADSLVNVPYAHQEKTYYCGPATLQMALSALGVASPATAPSWQQQLWNQIKAGTVGALPSGQMMEDPTFTTPVCEWCSIIGWKCWTTTPTVLRNLLNAQQAVGVYSIFTTDEQADATGVLLDTIDVNLPAIALVRGWKHWLVVRGYKHNSSGATPVAGRKLNGIYLKDPNVPATNYVTWKTWKKKYLSVVPCGEYEGSFLMVPGVRPGAVTVQQPSVPILMPLRPSVGMTPGATMSNDELLPANEILEHARTAARELTEDSDAMRTGLGSADPNKPVLVQNLDEKDSLYYIVNFTRGGRDTARVALDAKTGELLEASIIDTDHDSLPPFIAPTEMLERVLADADRYAAALRFRGRRNMIGQHPVLVWRACMESSSPFLPFYQFSIGDSFVYYRVDGLRCYQLTVAPA
jgi:hypothetical protein